MILCEFERIFVILMKLDSGMLLSLRSHSSFYSKKKSMFLLTFGGPIFPCGILLCFCSRVDLKRVFNVSLCIILPGVGSFLCEIKFTFQALICVGMCSYTIGRFKSSFYSTCMCQRIYLSEIHRVLWAQIIFEMLNYPVLFMMAILF